MKAADKIATPAPHSTSSSPPSPSGAILEDLGWQKPKAFTKDQYRLLAVSELGPFSKAAFDHAWISAIEDSGRQDWYDPKPRRKDTRQ